MMQITGSRVMRKAARYDGDGEVWKAVIPSVTQQGMRQQPNQQQTKTRAPEISHVRSPMTGFVWVRIS